MKSFPTTEKFFFSFAFFLFTILCLLGSTVRFFAQWFFWFCLKISKPRIILSTKIFFGYDRDSVYLWCFIISFNFLNLHFFCIIIIKAILIIYTILLRKSQNHCQVVQRRPNTVREIFCNENWKRYDKVELSCQQSRTKYLEQVKTSMIFWQS